MEKGVRMKTIIYYLITVSVIFLFGGIAMSDEAKEYREMSLYYENASGEKALTTFEYNNDGFLTNAVWERLDKSRNSLNFYSHDENGNLIRKYREYSDRIFSEETYEYDNDGKLLKENFKRSDGVLGTADYEYDQNGFRIKAVCNNLQGWINGEIIYINDKKGNKLSAEYNRDGNSVATVDYSYDTNGNLIKEFWDFGGKWNQTFNYKYDISKKVDPKKYTSSNIFIRNNCDYQLTGENYLYSDGSGGPSKFEYDKSGKLTNKQYDHSNGLYTKTTFLYDFKGRLTKSYRLYSSGLSGVFSYQFNEDEKLVKRIFRRSDGKNGEEIYNYDKNGKLIGGEWKNFDSWLTGNLTITYDKNGAMDKGIFKGANNFDADIIFDVDDNGNLIKINWDFSFGDSQTYTFEYGKIK